MHVHAGLNLCTSFALLAVAAGCAGTGTGTENASVCSVGKQCQLTGTLKILPGTPASVGVLQTAQGCVPLALPPEVQKQFGHWDRQSVFVSGTGFAPSGDADVTWVQLKDRKVATGVCNSATVIVYVTQIEKRKRADAPPIDTSRQRR
jgi:hypothetical protein